MAAFLISYDLRKQRNYEPLIAQLRAWGFISPLESVWLGAPNSAASAIRDAIRPLVDGDDGILVVALKPGADWATTRVNENAVAWLQHNVAP